MFLGGFDAAAVGAGFFRGGGFFAATGGDTGGFLIFGLGEGRERSDGEDEGETQCFHGGGG